MDATGRVSGAADAAERVRAVYVDQHVRLRRALFAFTRSREIAEEAEAEAFAQVLRRGDDVRDVAAWVWKAAFAIARGELQRRGPAPVAGDEHDPAAPPPDGLTRQLEALARMSDADRELIVLCHVAGWAPGELAGMLGISPGAVRVRLHRATREARELLESARRDAR